MAAKFRKRRVANRATARVSEKRRIIGAVEWIRTTTVLLPSAPQADASASSATTAQEKRKPILAEVESICEAAEPAAPAFAARALAQEAELVSTAPTAWFAPRWICLLPSWEPSSRKAQASSS